MYEFKNSNVYQQARMWWKSRYGRNGGLRRDGEKKNLLIYMDDVFKDEQLFKHNMIMQYFLKCELHLQGTLKKINTGERG